MRAKQLIETLILAHEQGYMRPISIEGGPGGGKTAILKHVAEDKLGIGYQEVHVPTKLVEDFDGSQAGNDLQKVMANIMQARTLHGVPMKDGWRVVRTGNRQSDRAGANKILSHLRNRETLIELETHIDDFCSWCIEHDKKPELISFVRFRPELLHKFDPSQDVSPTPRGWVEGVSDAIGRIPPESEYEWFKGAVGEGAAAEFVGFLKIHRKLPNPDTILMNPSQSNVPEDPATLYALCGALANKATLANFDRMITYVSRMPKEFSVLAVSYATRKNDELASSNAFTKWAVDHQEVLF